MALCNDHLDKARYNEEQHRKISELDNPPFDWLTTVAFYSALHYLHAYLDLRASIHPTSHKFIEELINPQGSYQLGLDDEFHVNYNALRNRSFFARYMSYSEADNKLTYKNISEKRYNEAYQFFLSLKETLLRQINILQSSK